MNIKNKIEKGLTDPKQVKTYDTDKYFITRISGGLLLFAIIVAVAIILVW